MKGKHFHCPVNGWDCPYYRDSETIRGSEEHCLCTIEDPYNECDDFFCVYGDEANKKDYTDFVEE